jgi:acyl-CoA synthetase (NDP forming)
VITTSGGLSGILADCLSAEGLQLAPLSEATKRAAQAVLPSYAVMGNPLDLTGYFDGAAQAIKTCIEAFDADPAVDTIVVAPGVPSADMYDIVASLRLAAAESATPLVLLTVGGKIVRAGLRGLHRSGLPWFDSPQACARALRLAKERRRFGTDQIMDSTPYIAPVLRQIGTPRLLGYRDACTLLAECEAGEVVGDIAMSGDDSVRLAQQAGYPVVLKALTEAVPHKSDRGAVRLCLRAADDVRTADAELRDTFPDAEILVQPQVSGGVEVLVGLVCDEQFGPTVAVATGGSLVNVIDDKVLRLAPVSPTEARRMLDNLAGRAQLAGVRGRPSADVDALIDLIVAVAKLGAQHSEVIAIDLNPVLVLPVGQGVRIIDAKVWAVATGVNERVPT